MLVFEPSPNSRFPNSPNPSFASLHLRAFALNPRFRFYRAIVPAGRPTIAPRFIVGLPAPFRF